MSEKRAMTGFKNFSLLLLFLSSVLVLSCQGGTPEIKTPNGIASIEKIDLGGVEQWILIRGQDKANPVLLFLHGGPGDPSMPTSHIFGDELEKHFVVVHWDQRGAGKSYHPNIPKESMNVNQFVSDTHQLIEILRKRFGVDKIYLVGHSWGSLLGILTVSKYPELFYAYIGIGQMVDVEQNESLSYQFVLEEARKRKAQEAVKALEKIGPPPYKDISGTITQRQYLRKSGGWIYDPKKPINIYIHGLLAPEYTVSDYSKFRDGEFFSSVNMWDEILSYNLFKQAPRIEVPVYFFEGRHDYCTSWPLVDEYYKFMDAPRGKALVWFDNSAHLPMNEEPDKFNQAMLKVLEETYKK